MKVTIVGSGFYGSTTALRVAEADIVDEVVMVDIIEDKPQGLALDMMQSRPIERFETRITGSNSYDATAGSDVCVITAGLPRKPGMSRMDLLEVNAKIVGDVTRQLVAGSPDSILIVVSNPLDEMTALAASRGLTDSMGAFSDLLLWYRGWLAFLLAGRNDAPVEMTTGQAEVTVLSDSPSTLTVEGLSKNAYRVCELPQPTDTVTVEVAKIVATYISRR